VPLDSSRPTRRAALVCALVLGLSAMPAAAFADSISLSGPSSTPKGQKASFTVQGEASSEGAVNYEIRVLVGTDACVPDFLLGFSTNLQSVSGGDPLIKSTGGPFSQQFPIGADVDASLNVCGYLISTNHPAAVTLQTAQAKLTVGSGSATKPATPSKATLRKRALAKCKKIKSKKKRAACVRKAKKKYPAK